MSDNEVLDLDITLQDTLATLDDSTRTLGEWNEQTENSVPHLVTSADLLKSARQNVAIVLKLLSPQIEEARKNIDLIADMADANSY